MKAVYIAVNSIRYPYAYRSPIRNKEIFNSLSFPFPSFRQLSPSLPLGTMVVQQRTPLPFPRPTRGRHPGFYAHQRGHSPRRSCARRGRYLAPRGYHARHPRGQRETIGPAIIAPWEVAAPPSTCLGKKSSPCCPHALGGGRPNRRRSISVPFGKEEVDLVWGG